MGKEPFFVTFTFLLYHLLSILFFRIYLFPKRLLASVLVFKNCHQLACTTRNLISYHSADQYPCYQPPDLEIFQQKRLLENKRDQSKICRQKFWPVVGNGCARKYHRFRCSLVLFFQRKLSFAVNYFAVNEFKKGFQSKPFLVFCHLNQK